MKFSKHYAYVYQQLPATWPIIIDYKGLKKFINMIVNELESKGLSVASKRNISEHSVVQKPLSTYVRVNYVVSGNGNILKPSIELVLPISGNEWEEKSISEFVPNSTNKEILGNPIIRRWTICCSSGLELNYHKNLAVKSVPEDRSVFRKSDNVLKDSPVDLTPDKPADKILLKRSALLRCMSLDTLKNNASFLIGPNQSKVNGNKIHIELDLDMDIKFTQELSRSLKDVMEFEKVLASKMEQNVASILEAMPLSSTYRKDFSNWRQLLKTYSDYSIFLQGNDVRSYESAKEKLEAFEKTSLEIANGFRYKRSREICKEFLKINSNLIYMLCFDEINSMAVRKILKKHDKRTRLEVSSAFMSFMKDFFSISKDLVRKMFFDVHEKLVTVIPQVEDYLCPICWELYWKPIRLECGHVFCVRCLAKSKLENLKDCPVCRKKNAVALAGDPNFDKLLARFLKFYFPNEVRAKKKTSKKEKAEEDSQILMGVYSKVLVDKGGKDRTECALM